MNADKARIVSIRNEIESIKRFILMNKRTVEAKKSDIRKVNERFKDQIARADRTDKASLREKKRREVDHLKKEIESQKKQIDDKKDQIIRKREEIQRLRNK
ncbi:MAG: hypothetical protein RIR96_1010 [Bacteroidota bacterium]|jgi:predicted  nucleic acid-binding Zn-ribbon protein